MQDYWIKKWQSQNPEKSLKEAHEAYKELDKEEKDKISHKLQRQREKYALEEAKWMQKKMEEFAAKAKVKDEEEEESEKSRKHKRSNNKSDVAEESGKDDKEEKDKDEDARTEKKEKERKSRKKTKK